MIYVKRLNQEAPMPTRGTPHAAGLDLRNLGETVTLMPGDYFAFPTGLAFAINKGFFGHVCARSGWARKHGIAVNGGIIDADFRGEVQVILVNAGQDAFTVPRLERMAQIIIKPYDDSEPVELDQLDETLRGVNGFGHTGTA